MKTINGLLYEHDNDLFFVCYILCMTSEKYRRSLAELISRVPKDYIENLYDYADVLHCENPDKICWEIVTENNIGEELGDFIQEREFHYHFHGYTLESLISRLYYNHYNKSKSKIDILIEVINSYIGGILNDTSQDLYWQSTECVYWSYVDNDEFLMYR